MKFHTLRSAYLFNSSAASRWLALTALVPALVACAFLFMTLPSWAEKPEWAGEGKHGHKEGKEDNHGSKHKHNDHDRDEAREDSRSPEYDRRAGVQIQIGGYFAAPQRYIVQEVYAPQLRGGRCPPGLARKHNGCLPPGQARAYAVGRPLPHSVIYYDVPPALVVQLGVPPSGHRYVRVAADILLIAVGTGMVVDAIGDLGR